MGVRCTWLYTVDGYQGQ